MGNPVDDFIAKAKADKDIQAKLAAVPGGVSPKTMGEVVKIAAAAGFTVSAADLEAGIKKHVGEPKKGELSEKDLANVAGGGTFCWVSHYTKGRCEGLTAW